MQLRAAVHELVHASPAAELTASRERMTEPGCGELPQICWYPLKHFPLVDWTHGVRGPANGSQLGTLIHVGPAGAAEDVLEAGIDDEDITELDAIGVEDTTEEDDDTAAEELELI
jgi:hypothetical protein